LIKKEVLNTPEQDWRNEEENEQDPTACFLDEEEDPNDLEIQSFHLILKKKEEPQSGNSATPFSEEKPVEFSFFVNEPVRNEPTSDFGQPKAEFNAPTSAVAEPAQKIETFYQKQKSQNRNKTNF
jgi:cell division protein FtsZ